MKLIVNYKFHLLTFLLAFLILWSFKVDTDFGWHLALGREFTEHGNIVRGDIFSWTMPGYVWGNSYFLYQIILAYIFELVGYIPLAVLFGLIGAFGVLILIGDLNYSKTVAILAGVGVAAGTIGVRPHTISFFLFAVLLVLLERGFFQKKAHIFFSFLFFVLWANFHRGFLIGLIVMATYFVVDYFYKKSQGEKRPIYVPILCVVAAVIGTLFTPFSWSLWNSGVVHDIRSYENLNYIAEWQPVLFFYPSNVLFVATGVIYIYIFWKNAKDAHPFWFLISALAFAFAFVSAAFLFFWGALFIFMTSRYLDFSKKSRRLLKFPLFVAIGVALLILAMSLVKFLGPWKLDGLARKSGYPVDAIKFLDGQSLATGLFNEFAWGGYVDWKMMGTRVFIDGRMSSWPRADGMSILGDYINIIRGDCRALNKYDVKTVLVARTTDTSCFGDFKEVYGDGVAKVLVRR